MKLPKVKTKDILVQHHAGEILIYDLSISKAYCLNETSAIVYQTCDGETTLAEVKNRHQLSDDLIYLALDQLHKERLLGENEDYRSPLANINRREAIRRAGLASLAALPVISVLIAPQAANAASLFAPGSRTLRQSCVSPVDCASSAANCTETPLRSGRKMCCISRISYYDTGGVVNSCSGPSCDSTNFSCQSDAAGFCCSGSATASCPSSNSCSCRCN